MRQIQAFEVASSLPLYLCSVAGCMRLSRGEYCCIWCEYVKTFGRRIDRHTSSCERRQSIVHVSTITIRPYTAP